jgi:hypothetical protein
LVPVNTVLKQRLEAGFTGPASNLLKTFINAENLNIPTTLDSKNFHARRAGRRDCSSAEKSGRWQCSVRQNRTSKKIYRFVERGYHFREEFYNSFRFTRPIFNSSINL